MSYNDIVFHNALKERDLKIALLEARLERVKFLHNAIPKECSGDLTRALDEVLRSCD